MKPFFTSLLILFTTISISAQEFRFDKEIIDYGKISVNSNGTRTFVFTNIGNKVLTISKITSSCGCTIPKKPEKSILPGQKGEITVVYNTKIIGGFHKSVVILSNAKKGRKIIKIKGAVTKGISLEKEKNLLSDF